MTSRETVGCGPILRHFRSIRKMSQLDLSLAAGVSARHVSFVESGRSQPSREMLLTLGRALELPLREQNALLRAGGYTESFGASAMDSDELAVIARSVKAMLRHLDPYPSLALDAQWNVLFANRSATMLFGGLLGGKELIGTNLARVVFSSVARAAILNWDAVSGELLERLRREALVDERSRLLLEGLIADERLEPAPPRASSPSLPVLPVAIRLGDRKLEFFTTITTLGTPMDVTLQELRIETYFPTDEATEELLRSLV